MARLRRKSSRRNAVLRYDNDNRRFVPRLVPRVPFKPAPVRRGGLFRSLAVAALLGEKRRQAFLQSLQERVLETEDRRRFDPQRQLAPAGALSRGARRLVVAPSYSTPPGSIPVGIGFADSRKVAICVRRKVRREVLLAKKRGGGGHRRPRRNYWSDVNC